MKRIRIFKNEQGWMAEFEDEPELKSLFGTTMLPTAFTAVADADRVLAEIVKLNPEHFVYLAGRA